MYIQAHHNIYNYNTLSTIETKKTRKHKENKTYNNVIIMSDTETSKERDNTYYIDNKGRKKYNTVVNYVVAWSTSIRYKGENICTIYGNNPFEYVEHLQTLLHTMQGDYTVIYFHNLAYDWVFLRKFLIRAFGEPIRQLQTKPHYPILLEFDNGLILKDSLILSQKSLEKWAEDLQVEHRKAVGKWDYNKIRTQKEHFTQDEILYICNDTLAGVECLDTTIKLTNSISIYYLPYTCTGIIRKIIKKEGEKYRAHNRFSRMCFTFEEYQKALLTFHGGYVHANRFYVDMLISDIVECYDETSAYPYVMLTEKYPMEKFTTISDKPIQFILDNSDEYAFMFKLVLIDVNLKKDCVMPYLQFSKCVKYKNVCTDNGRILSADYIEIYLTDIDLKIIADQYLYKYQKCTDIHASKKDYLPRWFTDIVYKLFYNKTTMKDSDALNYQIEKGKLNSCYGMTVQKSIRDNIIENFLTGDISIENRFNEDEYNKYINNRSSILPYQWGIWVTAYACYNLFTIGSFCETWLYSDTDSVYGINFDENKINAYNNLCIEKLAKNSYYPIEYKGKTYTLGIADFDGKYTEFKTMGAKRYACRIDENTLKLTVAGVPKKAGVKCLNNDLNNFKRGFIFEGEKTNKLTHVYNYIDDIYEKDGIIIGDYIDLYPCDYELDVCNIDDYYTDDITEKDILINIAIEGGLFNHENR